MLARLPDVGNPLTRRRHTVRAVPLPGYGQRYPGASIVHPKRQAGKRPPLRQPRRTAAVAAYEYVFAGSRTATCLAAAAAR